MDGCPDRRPRFGCISGGVKPESCLRVFRAFHSPSAMNKAIVSSLFLLCFACNKTSAPSSQQKGDKPKGSVFDRLPAQLPETSRFKRIRKLLAKDPDAPVRAYHLYPLVDPVCTSTDTRMKFVADAAAYVDVRSDPDDKAYARRLAIDTLEHVSTSCWRNSATAAYQILTAAKKVIPGSSRFDIIEARLKSAAGDFDQAILAADKARKAGSIHAIALTANIHAQIARQKSDAYEPGMLDKAISMVTVSPEANWPLIDLTAILSTRSRLLAERSNWEDGETMKQTMREARDTLGRLSMDPFIALTRRHALDSLCYSAVHIGSDSTNPCLRAAKEQQNLGAAYLAGEIIAKPKYDSERYAALLEVRQKIEKMPKGGLIILAVRGDEHEVIAWTRPAATVLASLRSKKPTLIVIDRTYSKRARANVDRILQLAQLEPTIRIDAGRDIFAMPCLTALVAGRKTPKSCPFDKKLIKQLIRMPKYEYGFLVGRDLDAEIDDLKLYELEAALLSYRKSLNRKGIAAHLKDLSDTWILSEDAAALSAKFKP